jgi:hypothetical protein
MGTHDIASRGHLIKGWRIRRGGVDGKIPLISHSLKLAIIGDGNDASLKTYVDALVKHTSLPHLHHEPWSQ